MSEFRKEKVDLFLGVVRKYMQVRGPMSQKELAELTEVGVSTMSRFLTQKTSELNAQLIAKIVAKLQIPLHEMIDFVEEDYSDRFIRLVKFFKGDDSSQLMSPTPEKTPENQHGEQEQTEQPSFTSLQDKPEAIFNAPPKGLGDVLEDELVGALGMAKTKVTANVSVGSSGNKNQIFFEPDLQAKNSELTLREKLEALTPRQKAYLSDFLSLDIDGRDLMVDFGNSLFRYMRIKGMNN